MKILVKILGVALLAIYIITQSALAMIFSQPKKIGTVGFDISGKFGSAFLIDGASNNWGKESENKYNKKANRKSYVKGIAKFGDDDKALYFHYDMTDKNPQNFSKPYIEGDEECKNSHIQELKLEQIVFQAICKRIEAWKRENKSKQKRSVSSQNNNRKNLEKLNRRIEFLKRKKFREYEQYTLGNISKEIYLQNKRNIDVEMSRLQLEAEEIQNDQDIVSTDFNIVSSEIKDICERFCNEKSLTYDMAHAFIKRILVSPNESIEIEWRYKS